MKKFLKILKMFIGPIIILVLLELFSPFLLHKVPLYLHGNLDSGLLALAQTSKRSLIPEDYILLLGNSNAVGLGEWLNNSRNDRRNLWPDFHTAHILNNKPDIDVISLGGAGKASLINLVFSPITQFQYINSFLTFNLKMPKRIIVIFDEGNDVSRNIKELEKLYYENFDKNRIYDTEYFRKFLDTVFQDKNPYKTPQPYFKYFMFSRFIFKGIKGLFYESKYDANWRKLVEEQKLHKLNLSQVDRYPRGHFLNIALVDNEKWVFSNKNVKPPIELANNEIRLGLYVFEQSLLYASSFFKDSKIDLVYLPSVTSSYNLLLPEESGLSGIANFRLDQSYLTKIKESEIFLVKEIESIAKKHGFGFIDVRNDVKKASKSLIIHGILDQNHFNKKGYHVFAESIIEQAEGF